MERVCSSLFDLRQLGVSDLVIVETRDALLVMKKGEGGKVGQIVDWLKKEERDELL